MRYSFLLPAYKAKYLKETLNSIKHQSCQDYTCLASDDCSSEDIKSIFDSSSVNESRFSYRRNADNMGSKSLVSHWNLLVRMCDSDYLIMASDDDVFEHEFLQQIDELTKKYPNVDVFRAKARKIQDDKVLVEDDDIPEFLTQEEFLTYFGKRPMVHCLANYVFKTSALKAIGGFPDFPKAGYSDAAAAMALSNNGIATTKDVLFSFRMSSENLSSSNGYNKYAEEGVIGCVLFADWYKDHIKPFVNFSGDIKQAHYNHVVEVAQYFLCRLTLHKSFKYYWQLRSRGFMNLHSSLTAIKNWIKVKR